MGLTQKHKQIVTFFNMKLCYIRVLIREIEQEMFSQFQFKKKPVSDLLQLGWILEKQKSADIEFELYCGACYGFDWREAWVSVESHEYLHIIFCVSDRR